MVRAPNGRESGEEVDEERRRLFGVAAAVVAAPVWGPRLVSTRAGRSAAGVDVGPGAELTDDGGAAVVGPSDEAGVSGDRDDDAGADETLDGIDADCEIVRAFRTFGEVLTVCVDATSWRETTADADDEEARVAFDANGTLRLFEEEGVDDGEEETILEVYDQNGTLRLREESRKNGEEEDLLEVFDGNGTLRVREENEDDDEEEELVELYDENGQLRVRERVEEDDDELSERFDENGTLRERERIEEDGDESLERFDESGTLRFSRREDEDGDVVVQVFDAEGELLTERREDED